MICVAVIGAGRWGKNVVRNLASLADVRLKYICDLDERVRRAMAAQYTEADVVADCRCALDDPAVQAVAVASGAEAHFELARAALLAGKHVYVEKPLALSSADARALVDLAHAEGRKLMVGHLLEYHPAVGYMKEAILHRRIGEPRYLHLQRVNLGIVRHNENAWWSLAPHDISVACYLLDAEPECVSATGQAYLQEGIEDVVFANLKFPGGKMAQIHVSWLNPHKVRRVTLVGSQKMIVFDDMEAAEKVRVYDKGAEVRSVDDYVAAITVRTGDILIPKIPNEEPLRLECEHFVQAISNGMAPRSDGADGLRVVKILEAGSKSLARGGEPVAV